ncbi:MAG: hypothetical protein J5806_01025 [Lentisphaeria bacterium]|nr:hypothetical protein [Lentisphaeria bacterium]
MRKKIIAGLLCGIFAAMIFSVFAGEKKMSEYLPKEKTGAAIQSAIDAAHAAGGGRVVLEPGVYLSGTIYLKSNVELHLPAGSKILGYDTPDKYDDICDSALVNIAPERSRKVLLAALHAENIAVTGQGEINGQGPKFYDTNVPEDKFFAKPPHPRPRMVQFFDCRNVRFEGVSFVDSPGWTFFLLDCEDVNVHRIRVTGCQQMINNDGLDIISCKRVAVSDSFFRTGDDCIIVRAIRKFPDDQAVCEDVVITNCVLDSRCQGIRIGCPSDDTIRRCAFSNITFRGRGNGINIDNPVRYLSKKWNDGGHMHLSEITFSNFVIESGRYPVRIFVEDPVKLRYIGRMTFSKFRIRSAKPILLQGNRNTWIDRIRFSEITLETPGGESIVSKFVSRLDLNQVELISGGK